MCGGVCIYIVRDHSQLHRATSCGRPEEKSPSKFLAATEQRKSSVELDWQVGQTAKEVCGNLSDVCVF